MAELGTVTRFRIKRLCAKGDRFAKQGKFKDAVARYESAWALLPEPKEHWEAATWIHAAVADALFLQGEYEQADERLRVALVSECPGALGNPFLLLRRGQCAYELLRYDRAREELIGAYMLEGSAIFESEDSKYFEWLKTQVEPPANGWGP
ncbi:MAG: tetratricopeptide repeat protein [Planctomycetaceae bacterium]|nr:tetratricopeptide repeat protein [Planctomycetaceae bacterium]